MNTKQIEWLTLTPDHGSGTAAISNYTENPHTGRDSRGPIKIRVRSQNNSEVYDDYEVEQQGAGLTLDAYTNSPSISGQTTSTTILGDSNALNLTFLSYDSVNNQDSDYGKFIYWQGSMGSTALYHYKRMYGVPEIVTAIAGGSGGTRSMQLAMYPDSGKYYIGVWDYHSIEPDTEPNFFLTTDTESGVPVAKPVVTRIQDIVNVISFNSASDIIPSTYVIDTGTATQTITNGSNITPDYGASKKYDLESQLTLPVNKTQFEIVWKIYVEARVHSSSAEARKIITITQGTGTEHIVVQPTTITLNSNGDPVNATIISNTGWVIIESPMS